MSDFRIHIGADLDRAEWAKVKADIEQVLRDRNATISRGGGGGGPNLGGLPGVGGLGGMGKIAGAMLGYSGLMAMRGLVVNSLSTARQQEQDLSNLNRRVGESAAMYSSFRADILATGAALGTTRQQIIQMTDTYVSSVGRMNQVKMAQDLKRGQEIAKNLGVAPELITGAFGSMGRYMQGGSTDTAMLGNVIANAIVSGGMSGREDEVVKELQGLTEMIGSRLPSLGALQVGSVASLMTAMNASGVQGLMGSRGQALIGGIDSFLQGSGNPATQNLLYRAYNQEAINRTGSPENIFGLKYRSESGIADPNNLSALRIALQSMLPGSMTNGIPDMQKLYAASGMTGMGMQNLQQLIPILMNQGPNAASAFLAQQSGKTGSPLLTEQDLATKSVTDFRNALQDVATHLMPIVTGSMNAMANLTKGLDVGATAIGGLGAASFLASTAVYALAGAEILKGGGSAASAITKKLGGGGLLGGGLMAIAAALGIEAGSQVMDTLGVAQSGMSQYGISTQEMWGLLTGDQSTFNTVVGRNGGGGRGSGTSLGSNNGDLRSLARSIAVAHGLDPNVFEAQINQESGFNPNSIGDSGASYGLGQINRPSHPDFFASGDPLDPIKNLNYAAAMMQSNLAQYGNYFQALEAYNAGGGNMAAGAGYAQKILVAGGVDVTLRNSDGSINTKTTATVSSDIKNQAYGKN